MLGRNYTAERPGRVTAAQLGRTLGFRPSISPGLPTCARVSGSMPMAGFGLRSRAVGGPCPPWPTGECARRLTVIRPGPGLEVHLLAPVLRTAQGDALTVDWLRFLRPETKFENVEALRAQIAADSAAARAFFNL